MRPLRSRVEDLEAAGDPGDVAKMSDRELEAEITRCRLALGLVPDDLESLLSGGCRMIPIRARIETLERLPAPPDRVVFEVAIIDSETGLMANGEPPPPSPPGVRVVRITPYDAPPAWG